MDYIKKNKFLTAVVAILVVLNIAVIAFVFFFFKPPALPRGLNARGDRFQFLEDRLNLSGEQKAKFKELRQNEFARMDSTAHRRSEAMHDLMSLLKTENPAPEQIQQKAAAIGALEAEQSTYMFKHFEALRAVCTPEQQKEFDKLVTDAMIQARGPRMGQGMRGPEPGGSGFEGPGLPPGGPPEGQDGGPGGPR